MVGSAAHRADLCCARALPYQWRSYEWHKDNRGLAMSTPTWPELQVERLKEYCASPECGTSAWIARQLNKEFGTAYTRNAVIGKMGRCDLTPPRPPSAAKEKKIKAKRSSRSVFNFAKPTTTPIIEDSPAIMPTEFPNKCSLFELTDDTGKDLGRCRFPVGDPWTSDFFFCGQPEADLLNGRPYCPAHARAARANRVVLTDMSGI